MPSISCPLLVWLRFQSLLISSVRTTNQGGLWADESIRKTDSGGGVMKRGHFWGSVFCLWSLEKGSLVLSFSCIGEPARSSSLTFFLSHLAIRNIHIHVLSAWHCGLCVPWSEAMGVAGSEGWCALITWPRLSAWEREPCVKWRVSLKGLVIKNTLTSLSLPGRKQLVWTWGLFFPLFYSVALQAHRPT